MITTLTRLTLVFLLQTLGMAIGFNQVAADILLSERFQSPALNGEFAYSIYLPPSYDAAEQRRYPTLYLLHGVGDNEKTWPRAGHVEATVDALIEEDAVPELIVVMPRGAVSWYVNSSDVDGAGEYETAIVDDLIAHVDATYRTLADGRSRAIVGHSMGGFGALRLAFRYPDRFVATVGMSPALWSRVNEQTRLTQSQERIFRGAFGKPFDPVRFLDLEPSAFINNLKNLSRPLSIHLLSGDHDFFGIQHSTSALHALLQDNGIAAELSITDGGHNWLYWRRSLSEALTRIAPSMGHRPPLLADASVRRGLTEVYVPDHTEDVAHAVELLPDSGGTIHIRAREDCYPIDRSVHLNRSNLSLIGEQGATLCLEDGVRQPVILVGSAARSVPEEKHVHNIRIEGLIVDGNRQNQGSDERAEDAEGRPHLKNNAISVHGAQSVYLTRLTLKSARSGGLVVSQRSRGLYVSDTIFFDNHFDGIAIDGGFEVFVNNFKSQANLASGISIDTGSGEIHFSNGLVANNGDNGIFIRDSRQGSFRGLALRDNCTHGVFASHVDEGVAVAHSGVRGLVFSGLDVVRNGRAGFFYGSSNREPVFSAHNLLHNSRFGGNREGPFAGDPDGIDELVATNVVSHSIPKTGPLENPLCQE
ncbi:MAG: alpha/beta hydrolase-fold protein [Pseudomonadota bacterium]